MKRVSKRISRDAPPTMMHGRLSPPFRPPPSSAPPNPARPHAPSRAVYMVDFAGPNGFAVELASLCREVVVLDHHKTAMEDLGPAEARPSNLRVTFDMGRSGASIARDHFAPRMTDAVRRMIDIVEDRDLWRNAIPESKAFYAFLGSLALELDVSANPGVFETLAGIDVDAAVEAGERILEEDERKIEERLGTAFAVRLGGASGEAAGWGRCLCVRADGVENLRSEIGNRLAAMSKAAGHRGIACVAYEVEELQAQGLIKVSLRGVGEEDTTPVTRHYGGGGHAKASSCNVDKGVFESWRIAA